MNLERKLAELDRPAPIADDRDFLEALGMGDAQAASFLGKSRQTLNNQLGPKRGGNAPKDYFKIAEILVLVIAARSIGNRFDEEAVLHYVEQTRVADEASRSPYTLLKQVLSVSSDINFERAAGMVLILPAFADLVAERPDAARRLRDIVSSFWTAASTPWVVVLSSTDMRARMAVQWLGLPTDPRIHAFSDDTVDHYVPMVLVYGSDSKVPSPYVLTEQEGLVAAPQYRAAMISQCVRYMIPNDRHELLFGALDRATLHGRG